MVRVISLQDLLDKIRSDYEIKRVRRVFALFFILKSF